MIRNTKSTLSQFYERNRIKFMDIVEGLLLFGWFGMLRARLGNG